MSLANVDAFVNINKIKPFQKSGSIIYYNPTPPREPIKQINPLKNKISDLIKMTRPKNIIPTMLLNFSGGWIMNPSFNNLIHSTPFIASVANTILVLMSSMIINDIYDCQIDKVNNPSRPIASGQIKRYEATAMSAFLIGSAEYINLHFLPENLQIIVHLAIIDIIIYTPILHLWTFKTPIFIGILSVFAFVFYCNLYISHHDFYKHHLLCYTCTLLVYA